MCASINEGFVFIRKIRAHMQTCNAFLVSEKGKFRCYGCTKDLLRLLVSQAH
jgi:hypothetical protein